MPAQNGTAQYTGTGSLSATVELVISPTFSLRGAGSLSPTVFLGLTASATFGGKGLMVALLFASASLNGGGGLSANTTQVPRIAFFAGAGALSVNVTRTINVAVQFNGMGRMCTQATSRIGRKGPTSNVVELGPGVSGNITVGGGV